MKTAGIIGGLGPETTAEFYQEVNFSCYQLNKTNRPPLLIWNVPLEYQIEQDLLVNNTGQERYIPFLVDAAQRLEKGGADFLVMPCNTLHIFIKEIREAVSIPVLSIVEETSRFLSEKTISEVGILATSTTIERGLYETDFKSHTIRQVIPDGFEQAKIGKMISNLVLSRHDNRDREELVKVIESFANKGVKNVILACTDLQLLLPSHDGLNIYDTMKILVDATVREVIAD